MDPYIDPEALDPAHPLTRRKLDNYARACAAFSDRAAVVDALPSKVTLQTTDRCNLACPHCQLPPPKKRASMAWSLLERVAEELFDDLIEFHPTNLGEPFAWPRFRDLCALLHHHGVLLDLTTNGTLLTPERVEWIAPIARDVKVSFDGATASTFERYRRGARFDAVCENVRGLVDRLARVRVRRAVVALQMALMQGNLRELPALVRLAADLGAHRVKAYHLFSFSEELDAESLMRDMSAYEGVLAEALAAGEELGVDLQLAEPVLGPGDAVQLERVPCHLPWHESWIDVDGSVLACHSHRGERAGHLDEGPFSAAWNGPLYQRIREGFALGRPAWSCGDCGMTLRKGAEHEPVPYDPAGFLHRPEAADPRLAHPSGTRWSGRMKPFDLGTRGNRAS